MSIEERMQQIVEQNKDKQPQLPFDFHQLVMVEIAKLREEQEKPVRFVLQPTSADWKMLSMIRAHSFPNVHPNDLLRFMVRAWWEQLFSSNWQQYQEDMSDE